MMASRTRVRPLFLTPRVGGGSRLKGAPFLHLERAGRDCLRTRSREFERESTQGLESDADAHSSASRVCSGIAASGDSTATAYTEHVCACVSLGIFGYISGMHIFMCLSHRKRYQL